jgi:hypothetical protein
MKGRKAANQSGKKQVTPRAWVIAVILAIGLTALVTAGGGHWRARAATNYYVSLTGSNSNSGALTAPFQTLRRAYEVASSGDTIFVFDGIYTNPDNWGTIDKDLTIQGLSSLAILNAGNTMNLLNPPAFIIAQGRTVTIRNIIINGNALDFDRFGGGSITIHSGATVTIDKVFIRNSLSTSSGGHTTRSGAIYNEGTLTVINGIFQNCAADEGGAIYNAGTLTVNNTLFDGHNSDINFQSGKGNGIYNAGTATISNSTFSERLATIDGGAIYNATAASMKLTNCTLSGNTASTSGGAIYNAGFMDINFCTLADNSASSSGGGIFNTSTGTLKIKNSIVANNTIGSDCVNQSGGSFIALGKNFDTDGSGAALDSDFQQVTPTQLNLGDLADSGLTRTIALGAGSVAIDAANDCTEIDGLTPVNKDQRGVFRCKCDVGAYEVETAPDTTPPVVVCRNLTVVLDNTGAASITAAQLDNGSTDDCHIATRMVTPNNFTCANLGANTVTLTVMDVRGDTSTCTAIVTVVDSTAPSLNCPNNLTVGTNQGCTYTGSIGMASASDACDASVTITNNAPAAFPKGTTTVIWKATDDSGNFTTCTQTVTVVDDDAPIITCSQNLTVPAAAGQCSATVSYAAPNVSDNCSNVGAPICTPPSNSAFAKGTTTVNCTVKDAANNQSACSFTVTVVDTQAPHMVCPVNIIANTPNPGQTTLAVSFSTPIATDNCGSVSVVCAPPSGTQFPPGVTTVTCTATDAASNQTSCSFTVTIFDYVIVDDTNGKLLRFVSTTGDYDFFDCRKNKSVSGRGVVTISSCKTELRDTKPDRTLTVLTNPCTKAGNATVVYQGVTHTLTDANLSNNLVKCP